MTALEFINRFLLQFLFVRLTRECDKIFGKWYQTGWGLMFWVVPFTGWRSSFKYLGRKKYRKLHALKALKPILD